MEALPPFPDHLPVADLTKISYGKLLNKDPKERLALFDAAETNGFLVLDFNTVPSAKRLLSDIDETFEVGKDFFAEDLEKKMSYVTNIDPLGYKPTGALGTKDGEVKNRDIVEFYGVPEDALINPKSTFELPRAFEQGRSKLESMQAEMWRISCTILQALEGPLNLQPGTFEKLHDKSEWSGTVFRFLHYPPQNEEAARRSSLLGHTDSGSLTILFQKLGGLQILPPTATSDAEENWLWVRPEPGCAIVNIGDPLVQLTGGILRSNYHRVLYTPGEQSKLHRYGWGYFLKPVDTLKMHRIQEGNVIPRLDAAEREQDNEMPSYNSWHKSKGQGLIAGRNDVQSLGGIRKRPRA